MRQRHEHLAAAPLALPHVILHDRVATAEAMLIAKPLEHPLRRVPLLAMNLAVALQPAVDDPGWDGPVTQLIAERVEDVSHLLATLSRPVMSDADSRRTDETRHPVGNNIRSGARHPREQAKKLF